MTAFRKIIMVCVLMSLVLLSTGCSNASNSEDGGEKIVSPTVFVTVFVTPITATPPPVTPLPTPIPTQPPPQPVDDPNAPWNVPIYFPGPGCSASRLHVEDRAFVAATGDFARVYNSTNIPYDPGVRDLVPGEEMRIIAGPKCDNDWVFWMVKMDNDELKGWVPEGNGETYFLLPLVSSE